MIACVAVKWGGECPAYLSSTECLRLWNTQTRTSLRNIKPILPYHRPKPIVGRFSNAKRFDCSELPGTWLSVTHQSAAAPKVPQCKNPGRTDRGSRCSLCFAISSVNENAACRVLI